MYEVNPNIEVLEEYNGAHTKILHRCKTCLNEWGAYPNNALKGHGCSVCNYKKNGINKTKKHEDFVLQIDSNIELLQKYEGAKKPMSCRCKLCNYIWNVKNAEGLLRTGCPNCAGIVTLTHEEFIEKVSKTLNKNTKIIGRYINTNTPIECECLICGNRWFTISERLINSCGCKKCADKFNGFQKRKTHEQFTQELYNVNPNVELLGKYIYAKDTILCKCNVCNFVWTPVASSLLCGIGCPMCASSKGEIILSKYMKKYNIVYISQKSFANLNGIGGKPLSYDFYLPQYNLLIEFQGEQHERPVEHFGGQKQFETQQEHDKRKREYAENNNINLLEIWYYDIDNIESILLEKINNLKLGSVETVIPA